MTLVEVALTSALLLAVTGALMSVLTSFNTAEKEIGSRLDGAATVSVALDEMSKELSAANPVHAARSSKDMGSAVTFSLPQRAGASDIRLTLDADGRLVRQVLEGREVRSTRYLGGGARFEGMTFGYATANGERLDPGVDAPSRIARCAAVVDVKVSALLDGARSEGHRVIPLRNADPGGEPC